MPNASTIPHSKYVRTRSKYKILRVGTISRMGFQSTIYANAIDVDFIYTSNTYRVPFFSSSR